MKPIPIFVVALAFVGLLAAPSIAVAAPGAGLWPGAAPQPQRPHPSVVRVISPEGDGTSYGSGTLVDVRGEHGLVLTNWHVVADAKDTIVVVFPDGFRSAAKVVTTDRTWDLAALAIWKPNVAPVPLASRPPRPGEPLTIAGYGSGTYRAASGYCTQYVAPGMNHPYEMVEVSTAARQGDSGGPILNAQGELVGVLFGAGRGTTSGSYCGRVSQFMATFMPKVDLSDPAYLASLHDRGANLQNTASSSTAAPPSQAPAPAASTLATANLATTTGGDAPVAGYAEPRTIAYAHDGSTSAIDASVPTSNHEAQLAVPQASPGAAAREGDLLEQVELFLAFVGGAAILIHGLRLLLPAAKPAA